MYYGYRLRYIYKYCHYIYQHIFCNYSKDFIKFCDNLRCETNEDSPISGMSETEDKIPDRKAPDEKYLKGNIAMSWHLPKPDF